MTSHLVVGSRDYFDDGRWSHIYVIRLSYDRTNWLDYYQTDDRDQAMLVWRTTIAKHVVLLEYADGWWTTLLKKEGRMDV
jgi:hypothetical protein